jgi:hypothetical protein
VGVAVEQLRPAWLAVGGSIIRGPGAPSPLPPMPNWAVITVIISWIVGWTAAGARKMVTRDA